MEKEVQYLKHDVAFCLRLCSAGLGPGTTCLRLLLFYQRKHLFSE